MEHGSNIIGRMAAEAGSRTGPSERCSRVMLAEQRALTSGGELFCDQARVLPQMVLPKSSGRVLHPVYVNIAPPTTCPGSAGR